MPRKKGGIASPEKIAIAERRAMALSLRKQGGSYRSIAAQLRKVPGIPKRYSEATAHEDVTGELQRLNAENSEAARDVKRLELERLDAQIAAVWPLAMGKNPDVGAHNTLLRISERRAKLEGLDAPVKIEDVTEANRLKAIAAELAEKYGQPLDKVLRDLAAQKPQLASLLIQ